MWAAESGHEEAFKLLVRKGARMDLRDKVSFSVQNHVKSTFV